MQSVWGVLTKAGDKAKRDTFDEGVGTIGAVVSACKGMVNHGTFRVCGNYWARGGATAVGSPGDRVQRVGRHADDVARRRRRRASAYEDACCMRHDKCCNKELTSRPLGVQRQRVEVLPGVQAHQPGVGVPESARLARHARRSLRRLRRLPTLAQVLLRREVSAGGGPQNLVRPEGRAVLCDTVK